MPYLHLTKTRTWPCVCDVGDVDFLSHVDEMLLDAEASKLMPEKRDFQKQKVSNVGFHQFGYLAISKERSRNANESQMMYLHKG